MNSRSFSLRSCVGFACLLAAAGSVRADAKSDLQAAAQKLADAQSYSWTMTTEGGFGANGSGKTEKDGYTSLALTMRDNTLNAVKKGDQAAVQTDDGWKNVAALESGDDRMQRFMAMAIRNFTTPAEEAQRTSADASEVTKNDDGTYTATLPEEAAKKLLSFRGRGGGQNGPQVSNAKASVAFTLSDGAITKMAVHVSGTVNFNGNDRDIDRTTTTEIGGVNSTKVDVPAEAKAALEAKPATQPQ